MSSPLGIPGLQQAEEIGRGGFGTVYRADEPEFGRAVAVKIIDDRVDDEEARRAFVRECQAMGRLSGHPHIATVHRGGTTELGAPYIVMDLLDGGSLADRLRSEGPLPWPEVLEIGVALAGALETAHRAGILHLDVKPANVLMSRFGEAKLADFGISRLPGVTATTDGRIRASIAYAAPERLLDGSATSSSDLYALGGTLYTLLAGEPAFTTKPGEDLLVAISRIVRQPVPDLRTRGVPDPVVRVVTRLLAKSPVDRFGSASDAAFALQAAQRATGRPVTRAVVEGAPASRGDTRTWPISPPPARGPDQETASDDQDPPLTRPRYVPRSLPERGIRDPAPTMAAAAPPIPVPRTPVRSTAAAYAAPAREARSGVGQFDAAPPPIAPTLVDPPTHHSDPAPGDGVGRSPGGHASGPDRAPRARAVRRPLLVAIAVVAVLGLAGGGGLLWSRSAPAPPPVVPSSSTATAAPATSTGPPPLQIAVASGVNHPDRDVIAAWLDGYFRAINDREYEKAFSYFSPDSAVADNGLAAFREGNSTTEVRRQRILSIEDLDGGVVRATVTYRSTQDAAYGPNGETCTSWHLAYELTGPEMLIRKARPVTRPQAC